MKTARVAIYTRVSTDEQSTKAQESELMNYAKSRRWTISGVNGQGLLGNVRQATSIGRIDARLSCEKV